MIFNAKLILFYQGLQLNTGQIKYLIFSFNLLKKGKIPEKSLNSLAKLSNIDRRTLGTWIEKSEKPKIKEIISN